MPDIYDFKEENNIPRKDINDIFSNVFRNYKQVVFYTVAIIVLMTLFIGFIFFFSGAYTIFSQYIHEVNNNIDSSIYNEVFFNNALLSSVIIILLFSIFTTPIYVGVIYLMHKANIRQKLSFSDIFIGYKNNLINIVLYGIFSSIVVYLCSMTFYFPAVFIFPLLLLAYPILLFENASVIGALKKSFEIAKDNYWNFVLINLLGYLASMSGMIVCFIGVIFTTMFYTATMYSTYVAYVGLPNDNNLKK